MRQCHNIFVHVYNPNRLCVSFLSLKANHFMSSFYDFALDFVGMAAYASNCVKFVGYLNLVSSIKRIQEAHRWLTDDEQVTLVAIWNQLHDCYSYSNLSHSDLATQRQFLKIVANNILTRAAQSHYNDPNGHVAMSSQLNAALLRIAYGLRPRYQNRSSLKVAESTTGNISQRRF
jgi:hypothetical protein